MRPFFACTGGRKAALPSYLLVLFFTARARGLGLGIALVVYGTEEEADTL